MKLKNKICLVTGGSQEYDGFICLGVQESVQRQLLQDTNLLSIFGYNREGKNIILELKVKRHCKGEEFRKRCRNSEG